MSEFTKKLSELPGYQKFLVKQSTKRCPRCQGHMEDRQTFFVCKSCKFTYTLPTPDDKLSTYQNSVPDFLFGDWGACFYCGRPPECKDHVIPRSYLINSKCEAMGFGTRVISCNECNTILGAQYFPQMEDRVIHVQNRIRRKYYPVLKLPSWTIDEIALLGHRLRQHVSARMSLKNHITKILEWPGSPPSVQQWITARENAHKLFPHNKWLQHFLAPK